MCFNVGCSTINENEENIDNNTQVLQEQICSQTTLNNSIANEGDLSRIIKAMEKAQTEKEIKIAFLGGSITYGAGTTVGNDCYSKIVEKWFKAKFPEANIISKNAGISGTDSLLGIHRLKKDVLDYNPDFVIVEYAVNDGVNGDGTLKIVENSYAFENIIRDILSTDNQCAVLPLICCTEGGWCSQQDKLTTSIHYSLPVVSYKNAVEPLIESGEYAWSDLTKDGIHPNNKGHKILGELVTNLLEKAYARINEDVTINQIPSALTSAIFTNADMLTYKSENITSLGNFNNGSTYWCFKDGFTPIDNKNAMVVDVECKTFYVFINKTINNKAAKFEIIVDDNEPIYITTKSDTGYEQLTCEEILINTDVANHSIKIRLCEENPDGCDGTNNQILALLISK